MNGCSTSSLVCTCKVFVYGKTYHSTSTSILIVHYTAMQSMLVAQHYQECVYEHGPNLHLDHAASFKLLLVFAGTPDEGLLGDNPSTGPEYSLIVCHPKAAESLYCGTV